MGGARQILSDFLPETPGLQGRETPYARDRIIKRESYKDYKEAPNANIVASLSELGETDSDKLPVYDVQNQDINRTESANDKVMADDETVDEETNYDDDDEPEPEIKDDTTLSNCNKTTTPSITKTNDVPDTVPNNNETNTEGPRYVTSFKPELDLEVSKWTDFQEEIKNILPSRVFSPVPVTNHFTKYDYPRHKSYQYPSTNYQYQNSIITYSSPRYQYSDSDYQAIHPGRTPNYGFTRHSGPVYSRAVNAGRFGSLGGLFGNHGTRHQEGERFFPENRMFEVDPVIRRMIRNLNVYQTYPDKHFHRPRRKSQYY